MSQQTRTPQFYGAQTWMEVVMKTNFPVVNAYRTSAILKTIPKEDLTDEFLLRITEDLLLPRFTANELALLKLSKYIHPSAKTTDLLKRLVPQEPRLARMFPPELFTKDIIIFLARNCSETFLEHLPFRVRKDINPENLIAENPRIFCCLPEDRRTVPFAEQVILAYLDNCADAGSSTCANNIAAIFDAVKHDTTPFSLLLWKRLLHHNHSYMTLFGVRRPDETYYLRPDAAGNYRPETWELMDTLLSVSRNGGYAPTIMQFIPLGFFEHIFRKARENKIAVETSLGRLEACIGGDPAYPEIFTYLVLPDGEEMDLVACEVKGEEEEAKAYLYGDPMTDQWTRSHRWTKNDITAAFCQESESSEEVSS